MFILLMLIGIGLCWLGYRDDDADVGVVLFIAGAVLVVAMFALGAYNFSRIRDIDYVYPEKISFLEEENERIEETILEVIMVDALVDTETIDKMIFIDDVSLSIQRYCPELAYDPSIASLLVRYRENKAEIREKGLIVVDRPGYAFWLYFGK